MAKRKQQGNPAFLIAAAGLAAAGLIFFSQRGAAAAGEVPPDDVPPIFPDLPRAPQGPDLNDLEIRYAKL